MLHDLRYAFRTLRRSPGFTVSVILALVLGIGANTAVFSIVYAVLLKPLPYAEPDRLVRLYERNPAHGIERGEVSPGTFVDWRTRSHTLESVAVFTWNRALWAFGDRSDIVTFSAVSPALFDVLEVTPVLGRTFRPEAKQDRPFGDSGEVVISFDLWQRRFSGSPSVLGRTVSVEGRFPLQIIGVMPRGFSFPDGVDAWGNLAFVRPIGTNQRQMRYYDAVARLAPNRTIADARTELSAISAQLAAEQPPSNAGWTAQIESLDEATTGGARTALLVLLGAAGGVLLIGCVNVANLLLARATARRREMAVRVALGAGTARLVRQSFTEVVLLAALGTVAGVLLGHWLTAVLVSLAPSDIPRLSGVGMNRTLLLFAATAGLASAAFIALMPALQVRRAEQHRGLKSDARVSTDRAARVRRVLIAAEMAIVILLLTGAMLLIRSFVKLRGVDLGFSAQHVLAVEMRWPTGRFNVPSRRPWFMVQQRVNGLIAAIESVPGVEAAGLVTDLPLAGDASGETLWRADAPGASGTKPPASAADQWQADLSVVTPGYFNALGIPIVRGRNFAQSDRLTEQELTDPDLPRSGVAIINTAFASRYFPKEDPLGHRLVLRDDITFGASRTIVGIVADVRGRAVGEEGSPAVYLPHAEHPDVFRPTVVVRSTLPPDAIAAAIRERVRVFDPQLLVMRMRPMAEVVSGALARPRFNLLLVGGFALLALSLGAIGIYAVVAFVVAQRTREIGVRIALGARRRNVLMLVLGEGLATVVAGAVLGLGAAALATRALRTLVFGVTPLDPVSFALSPVVLVSVAALACLLPAVRATRVDPIVTLRDE